MLPLLLVPHYIYIYIYIYPLINDILKGEQLGDFIEITLEHLYTFIYINVFIYNGNSFSWSRLFLANIC